MSFQVCVIPDVSLLYVRGSGVISAADVDAYYQQLKDCGGIELCQKALVDLYTDLPDTSQLPIRNIRNLGWLFKQRPLLPKGTKMAMVLNSKLSYAFARLFIANRGEHITIKAFMDMSKAKVWLELDDAALLIVSD